MKINNLFNRITLFTAVIALGLLASCQDQERLTGEDATDVVSESLEDAYFEDVTDMGLAALDDKGFGGGREATDDRFNQCVTISVSPNSTLTEGSLIIDFGDGCTGPRGNTRAGIIHVAWSNGPAGNIGFTVVYTFDGYSINGVQLQGTRTVTRIAPEGGENNVRHSITLDNGKATWPDGTFTTRESAFEREWVKDPENERITLDGEASGVNRRGKSYTMAIRETLEYRRACFLTQGIHMAVKGVKVFTVGDRKIIIDYGDGRCDRIVTVTIGDLTRDVNVGS
jgi:hypothetical protein